MSTALTGTIQGRLGTYTLTVYDTEDVYDEAREIEVVNDVKIEWGDQGRDYPEQILKSRCRLDVAQGAEAVRDILRGGFDRRRYKAEIVGPGVDWGGFIQPESRTFPFTTRTRPTQSTILIADDASKAKNEVSSQGAVFGEDAIRQWAGSLKRADLTPLTQEDGPEDSIFTGVQYGPRKQTSTYERLISFASLMGLRLYRPLDGQLSLMHELRSTGQGVTAHDILPAPGSSVTLPGDVYEPDLGDIEDTQDAFQDVEQAGTIKVELGDDYNLVYAGACEITEDEGEMLIAPDLEEGEGPFLEMNGTGSSASDGTIRAHLGSLSPTTGRPLGLRLTWNVVRNEGGGSVTLSNGSSISSTSTPADEELIVPALSSDIDAFADFQGTEFSVSDVRCQFLDQRGRRVETLFNRTDPTGVEGIEIDNLRFPRVEPPNDVQYTAGITYYARRMDHPLFSSDLGFLARAQMIRQYRPFGIQSVQTRIFGLYGPEDMLILPVPDGNDTRRAPFVCGQGRSVNLTTGTTEISDVEIPSEILPTDVL